MKAIVKKWGNGFAIQIPKLIMDDAELKIDSEVDISFLEGKIIVSPILPKKISLISLIDQISDDNIHEEVDTGPAIGKEVE